MSRGFKTGGGSRKGRPNKLTRDIKEMIVNALHGAGGEEYLKRQAEKNPAAFLALLGRVLPLQVSAPDGPILIVTGTNRPEEPHAQPVPQLGQSTAEPIDVTPIASKLTH